MTTISLDPVQMAVQAECVLHHIGDENPPRQALHAFIVASNQRLDTAVENARKTDDSMTGEARIDALEAASLDLFYAIALYDAILADDDGPEMDAVGTLLRLAKDNLDDMTAGLFRSQPDPQAYASSPAPATEARKAVAA